MSAPASISALPKSVSLVVYAGDDFYLNLAVANPDGSPADLSGVTVKAQIRAHPEDPTIAATFAATVAANTIGLHLAAAQTATLAATACWDCQLTHPAGDIVTIAAGKVSTVSDVTRP